MNPSGRFSARPLTLKALCSQMCVFYSTMCLACWPLASEASRRRCGSDLLSDLIFVCGDRGIYFGKGTWSGYGARPRGKGIVDKCCRSSGCELHHLEMYCAKPKAELRTTASPATSTPTPTPTAPRSTTQTVVAQQLKAAFQRRPAEHLGAPGGQKRDAPRKTTPSLLRRKIKPSRRKINAQHSASKPS